MITSFFHNVRANWKRIAAFVVTLLFVLLPVFLTVSTDSAFAQTNPTPAQGANTTEGAGDIGMLTRLGNVIGNMIITIASGFTYFGGMLLDTTIKSLVFGMGEIIRGTSFGGTIDGLWTLIRDIANLAFIFGFIYAGISTIINSENNNTKRMLASIIIGALLINFSLFFTKVVIDFANFTAVEIYKSMSSGGGSISANFVDKMGMLDLRNANGLSPKQLAEITAGGQITYFILAAIFLMVAGFVFAAGAVLLVIRFVALIFIMIFSPLLFAATVFPKTAGYAEKLWAALFSYSFFAPVYLLLMLVSLKIVTGLTTILNSNGAKLSQAIGTNNLDAFDVALIFVVATVFIIMSLQLAQKMGMAGGSHVVSMGKSLRNYGQRVVGNSTFGAAAAANRAVFGRLGNKFANNDKLKDRAATSWTARQALKLSRVAADSSFDARNIGGVGKKIGIGEGRKGGYETIQKEVTTREKKFAESLDEVGDEDELVKIRKDEAKKHEDELAALKRQLNLARDPVEKQNIREQIQAKEKEVSGAQLKVKEEKQRRVLGSTFKNDEIESRAAAAQAQLEASRNLIKRKQAEATRETDPARIAEITAVIKEQEKEITKAKNEVAYFKSQPKYREGYAQTLKKTNYWKTMIWNNDSVRNRQVAGAEIEKAFKKKLNKTKEQENQDKLIEAVKAGKKDD